MTDEQTPIEPVPVIEPTVKRGRPKKGPRIDWAAIDIRHQYVLQVRQHAALYADGKKPKKGAEKALLMLREAVLYEFPEFEMTGLKDKPEEVPVPTIPAPKPVFRFEGVK